MAKDKYEGCNMFDRYCLIKILSNKKIILKKRKVIFL